MSAFVNILRGTSGSGKSYVGHALIDAYPHEEVFEDGWNKIKPRLIGYKLPDGLYVLGSYRAAGGGLDTLSPQDRSRHFELIKRYAERGKFVFAEALVLSTMIPKLLTLAEELGHENVAFPTLDTPVEKCIAQIYLRNGGKPIKEQNVKDHWRSVARGTTRLRDAGLAAPPVDHEHSVRSVIEMFRTRGWRPEEESDDPVVFTAGFGDMPLEVVNV